MSRYVTIEYEDGSKYCGESKNRLPNGYGALVKPSKGVYEGLWAIGQQVSGRYTWSNGKQYIGEWKGLSRNGLGVETRPDGTTYSGEFVENMVGPLGVLSLPLHGLYLGMWAQSSVQEGEGVEAYADGGFYRGQYKGGKRSGHGTRSSLGYEKEKRKRRLYVSSGLSLHRSLSEREEMYSSADDITETSLNQVYEGEWKNDKRCGYGILKVSKFFTYYGEWKENSRTGYGVLVYEVRREKSGEERKMERIEKGRWDNGELKDQVKKKFIKTDLEIKVDNAHTKAIQAACLARDKATFAESKANAAAARSQVAEIKAVEARRHAAAASRKVEDAARISRLIIEDTQKLTRNVKQSKGDSNDMSRRLKIRSTSVDADATFYSYQLAVENHFSQHRSISLTSSLHNMKEITHESPRHYSSGSSSATMSTGSSSTSSL